LESLLEPGKCAQRCEYAARISIVWALLFVTVWQLDGFSKFVLEFRSHAGLPYE
jgi:hypothetical protein